jgi:hypothetical protein
VLIQQIAIVRQTPALPEDEFLEVTAAIQKQVTRDFARVWDVDATVDPFLSLDRVPVGYVRVLVMDDIHREMAGVHETEDAKPFALVTFREDWDTLASHEVLELLADPTLSQRVAGNSPDPQQGRVEFLVEVCDPCQDPQFGYQVNNRWMSDFYTPAYFDPVAAAGVRYSFQGSIKAPRQVLRNGYLSWRVPQTGKWWMLQDQDGTADIVPIPPGTIPSGGNLRGHLDRYTEGGAVALARRRSVPRRTLARRQLKKARAAMKAEADALRSQLGRIFGTDDAGS